MRSRLAVSHAAYTGISLIFALGMGGCGSSGSSSAPSPVRPSVTRSSAVVSHISGFVLDTGYRVLAGASVVVVDGPQAGTATTADATGQISLAGTFDRTTKFRATREGYVAAEQTWNCSIGADLCSETGARPWLGFYLASPVSPVNLAGDYTVTFTADNACTEVPPELRTRTYLAAVTPSSEPNVPAGTSFTATARNASFLGNLNSFLIGVSGDYVDVWLHGGHDPALVEQLGPSTYLAISGNAAASVATSSASTVTAQFDGWIEYCVMPAPMGPIYNCGTSNTTGEPTGAAITRAHCESPNHRLTLTRR